jgi:antitoxin (DNA-binding transcriptional repressor) of toxin-antitoxin stability system
MREVKPMSPVNDDRALGYTIRDLNQRPDQVVDEIRTYQRPAYITRRGRFLATIRPFATGQVESLVMPEIARQIAKESPVVRVDDDEALVFTMRELNQQTARVIDEIEKAGKPAVITKHGRFVAIIRPLTPGQVESRILPEIARQIAQRD